MGYLSKNNRDVPAVIRIQSPAMSNMPESPNVGNMGGPEELHHPNLPSLEVVPDMAGLRLA